MFNENILVTNVFVMEKTKTASKAIHELADSYTELSKALKSTTTENAKTKKLWREGNKSNLIKIGVACIMFPDPSPIGEIIGAGFLVAGAVQKGIQKRTLYVNDIKKNLECTFRQLRTEQYNL